MEILEIVIIVHLIVAVVCYSLHKYTLSLNPERPIPPEIVKCGKWLHYIPILNLWWLAAIVEDLCYIKFGWEEDNI